MRTTCPSSIPTTLKGNPKLWSPATIKMGRGDEEDIVHSWLPAFEWPAVHNLVAFKLPSDSDQRTTFGRSDTQSVTTAPMISGRGPANNMSRWDHLQPIWIWNLRWWGPASARPPGFVQCTVIGAVQVSVVCNFDLFQFHSSCLVLFLCLCASVPVFGSNWKGNKKEKGSETSSILSQ